MKRFIIFLLLLLLFLLLLLLGFFFVGLSPGPGEEKRFVINKGESLTSIGRRLQNQDLVLNNILFLAYVRLTGNYQSVQAGSFNLSTGDNIKQLISKLKQGREGLWVTFLEGWRREQYADVLEKKLGIDSREFLSQTRGKEGYLFPDSYLFSPDLTTAKIVSVLENNFDKKWQKINNQSGLTKNQVVILASLIEKEAREEEDLRIVAGILAKRLEDDWPLQVDATVQYAKASLNCSDLDCDWWPKIYKKDLELSSNYNLYKKKGLPPSPICNPSLTALQAAANYKNTQYWYYLSDLEGNLHFAKTLEDHNRNVNRFLK